MNRRYCLVLGLERELHQGAGAGKNYEISRAKKVSFLGHILEISEKQIFPKVPLLSLFFSHKYGVRKVTLTDLPRYRSSGMAGRLAAELGLPCDAKRYTRGGGFTKDRTLGWGLS